MIVAQGVALFLFIPAVLVLFLRVPFGAGTSLAIGVVLMLGHRFVARPFMSRHLHERCFWCGRVGGELDPVSIRSGKSVVEARACRGRCARRLDAFARAVAWARPALATLILVPLALYLANGFAFAAGVRAIPLATAAWGFKIPIALAVVTLSFLHPLGVRAAVSPAIDFPFHNLFLLGIRNTLVVFRLVGLFWLGQGIVAVVRTI